MGYYSDVGLALTDAGKRILQNRLAMPGTDEQILSETIMLLSQPDAHAVDKESGAELWAWSQQKWYIDDPVYYPAVYFMEKLLKDMEEEDYLFVRAGEDCNDIEMRGRFDENPFGLTLAREVYWDRCAGCESSP